MRENLQDGDVGDEAGSNPFTVEELVECCHTEQLRSFVEDHMKTNVIAACLPSFDTQH